MIPSTVVFRNLFLEGKGRAAAVPADFQGYSLPDLAFSLGIDEKFNGVCVGMDVDETGADGFPRRVYDRPGLGGAEVPDSLDAVADDTHIGPQRFVAQSINDRPVLDQDVEAGGRSEQSPGAESRPQPDEDAGLSGHLDKIAAVERGLHSDLLFIPFSQGWVLLNIKSFVLSTEKARAPFLSCQEFV
jgi:hypothetical protein